MFFLIYICKGFTSVFFSQKTKSKVNISPHDVPSIKIFPESMLKSPRIGLSYLVLECANFFCENIILCNFMDKEIGFVI